MMGIRLTAGDNNWVFQVSIVELRRESLLIFALIYACMLLTWHLHSSTGIIQGNMAVLLGPPNKTPELMIEPGRGFLSTKSR